MLAGLPPIPMFALTTAAVLAGCAAQLPATDTVPKAGIVRQGGGARPAPVAGSFEPEGGRYVPSEDEQALDCRKLRGRILVRIAHMRDAAARNKVSDLSRTLQSVTTPVFGGTTYGLAPAEQVRRDRAQLEGYNRLMVAKSCKQVDIDAELAKPE